MSPPTEQLIRDYLNRLSVAARGRLSPDERRTLIERTRQLIEQKADFAGRPTTLEVGRVLARLGDPGALVDQEVRRLGGVTAEPEHHVVDGGFLAKVLRREPAWVRGAHWSPPPAIGTEADGEPAAFADAPGMDAEMPDPDAGRLLSHNSYDHDPALAQEAAADAVLDGAVLDGAVLDGAVLDGAVHDGAVVDGAVLDGAVLDGAVLDGAVLDGAALDGAVLDGAVVDGAALDGAVLDGAALDDAGIPAEHAEPVRPQWPDVIARDAGGNGRESNGRLTRRARGGKPADGVTAGGVTLNGAAVSTGAAAYGGVFGEGDPPRTEASSANAEGIDSAWQFETPSASAAGKAIWELLGDVFDWCLRRPLETAALLLLGLGGLIYPPVFLLGAAVALLSRLWDYRDKWTGLALPFLLAVIGLSLGIAMGGRSHGFHEGWIWLNVSSRAAAALGAGYLAWRTTHGRRSPAVPPWNKQHKLH